MAQEVELTPRQELSFKLTNHSKGKVTIKMVDRINVDDVFLHEVNKHIYRLITGEEASDEVNPLFKQFLLKEQFIVGRY